MCFFMGVVCAETLNPPFMALYSSTNATQREVAWSTRPGIRYVLQESSNLTSNDWKTVAGFPTEAEARTQHHLISIAAASNAFYRVQLLDEQSPEIVSQFPEADAFAIPRFAEITITLDDASAIDPQSIALTVGDLGVFSMSSPQMSFTNNVFIFDNGGDTALGGYGSTVDVRLIVADVNGYTLTNEWSFTLERETIVNGDLLVLGSPEAQHMGQQLSTSEQNVFRMVYPAAGPIRMSSSAPWALEAVTDSALLFSYTSTAPSFQVGQYLANASPDHKDEIFYRKVVSTTDHPASQQITVFTSDVSLAEMLAQASLYSINGALATYIIAEDGLMMQGEISLPMGDTFGEPIDLGDAVTFSLNGEWSFVPKLIMAFDIQGHDVENLYFRYEGTSSIGVNPTLTATRAWSKTATKTLLPEKSRVDFLGMVGPVPIWAETSFKLDAEAGVVLEGQAELSTGFSRSKTFFAEMRYGSQDPSKNGWSSSSPEATITTNDFHYKVSGHGKAWVSLTPQVDIRLESLIGGYVNLVPELGMEGYAEYADGKVEEASFNLYGKIDVNAGVSLIFASNDQLPALSPYALVDYGWWVGYPGGFRIVESPESQRVEIGKGAVLSCKAIGERGSNLKYQWYHNDKRMLGKTEPGFSIKEVDASDAGDYYVMVSSGSRKTNSVTATLQTVSNAEDGLTYTITEGTVTITGFEPGQEAEMLILPRSIQGYPVTAIGGSAFRDCTVLENVVIPESVKTIGGSSFQGSGLTNITIPSSITSLQGRAFRSCANLTEVILKADVYNSYTTSDYAPFWECTNITSFTIGDSVTYLPKNMLLGCSGLTSMTIPESVKQIDYRAFSGCGRVTELTLQGNLDDVAYIYSAFSSFNLKTVKFGESVTSLPGLAFYKCGSLENISIPNTITNIGTSAFRECTGLTSIDLPDSITAISATTFYGCTNLTSITIPESVKTIGGSSFQGSGLTNITIPSSITSLQGRAFRSCANLTEVILKADVYNSYTTSDYAPFWECTNITSFTIGDSVTYLPKNMLLGCSGLTSMTIPESVKQIDYRAFSGCGRVTELTLQGNLDDVAYIYSAFSSFNLKTVKFGESVTSLPGLAFYKCGSLENISIPNTITNIGTSAFKDCTALTSIKLPGSITAINPTTFYGCTNLTSITIPEPVKTIGGSSFQGSGLTSVTIPETVTRIESHAFCGCTNLASITIPESVGSLGNNAFENCTGLTEVTLLADTSCYYSPYSSDAQYAPFLGCSHISNFVIGEGVTELPDYLFNGCVGLTHLMIPASVTTIDRYAFYGCGGVSEVTLQGDLQSAVLVFSALPNLRTVNIGSSVTTIPSSCFYDCDKLTEILLPNSLQSLGSSVFSGCTGITSISIPASVTSLSGSTFSGCSNLTSINLSENSLAFSDRNGILYNKFQTSLIRYPEGSSGSLSIPDGVTYIDSAAFRNCSGLTSISFPYTARNYVSYAPSGCSTTVRPELVPPESEE